jgi:hypothetical protein
MVYIGSVNLDRDQTAEHRARAVREVSGLAKEVVAPLTSAIASSYRPDSPLMALSLVARDRCSRKIVLREPESHCSAHGVMLLGPRARTLFRTVPRTDPRAVDLQAGVGRRRDVEQSR